jgi:hypothetical protein
VNADDVAVAGTRVARVVGGVVGAAVLEATATGVTVLADWTPEGELLYEWLVRELGEGHVWRAASLASNVHQAAAEPAAGRAGVPTGPQPSADGALTAHPSNKTALLLGGRVPHADLLPLGDVWASQIERLTGRWSAPAEVEAAAAAVGGIEELDAALRRLVEDRCESGDLGIGGTAARHLVELYERGRFYRLRPRLVPKLTARTLGIDLFD